MGRADKPDDPRPRARRACIVLLNAIHKMVKMMDGAAEPVVTLPYQDAMAWKQEALDAVAQAKRELHEPQKDPREVPGCGKTFGIPGVIEAVCGEGNSLCADCEGMGL